jgi:cytochrome c oxidase cbb3-type subunit 3
MKPIHSLRVAALVSAALIPGSLTSAALASPALAADADHGKALYDLYCTQCHGTGGKGDGVNAPELDVKPRNHTDRAEMSARSDADLVKAIKHGGQAVNKSILMPSWSGNMTDGEIDDVVAYLRRLCCQAAQ